MCSLETLKLNPSFLRTKHIQAYQLRYVTSFNRARMHGKTLEASGASLIGRCNYGSIKLSIRVRAWRNDFRCC